MLRLQRCVWLFVVLWLAEQQNVRSSEAPAENFDTSELKLSGEFPVDTLGKLHAEAAAQQEITASKMAVRILSKKQTHLIALFVLFLILMKVISVRMQKERKKAEEERLKVPPKAETEPASPPPQVPPVPKAQPEHKPAWFPGPLKDALDRRVTRGRKTKKQGRKDKAPEVPPTVVPAPGAPGVEHPVPPQFEGEQPYGGPAYAPAPIIEDDDEMRELKARMVVVNKLVEVAVRLGDELPPGEAQSIIDALKADAAVADQEERNYDVAKAHGDPNFESVRNHTANVLTTSLEKVRSALVQLSNLARQHGEELHASCSTDVTFTNVKELEEPLKESLDAPPVASCIATLSSLGNSSITLQQESEDSASQLRSLKFVDECDADNFVRFYSAISTLNHRRSTLKRLSDLDKEVKGFLLGMHKAFLKAKFQGERIPIGMQGNFVQGIHTVLVKSRPTSEGKSGSGLKKAELSKFSALFSEQTKELRSLDTAENIEGATKAYKRLQELNGTLKSLLDEQVAKISAVLLQEPLSKEEATSAASNMQKIGGTVASVADEFSRAANYALELASSKTEDVGAGLLQKLTKSKTTVDLASDDLSVADAVKAAFTEMSRQLKTEAKRLSSRAHEIVETNKKEVKYRLDGRGLESTALSNKTALKTEAAQKTGDAKLLDKQLLYLRALSREIGSADSTLRAVSTFNFRFDSQYNTELSKLKDTLEAEKTTARETQSIEAIAETIVTIQSIALQMRKTLESERCEQLSADISKARANLHDAGRQ
ncbi:hypothetical protein EMWEY_00016280 [Eimeria maxima]|uniref:Myosin heavy chain n=1 Tax=Eimeria maxima TaxID=5804 RepID=U6M1F9_EIMMA|nr:hypothetical protein EMWEY_00016280 [Eimeria maxima]CDJ56284.1 hypothetical protein EMWEY_00016280 [Eimeria maxima]